MNCWYSKTIPRNIATLDEFSDPDFASPDDELSGDEKVTIHVAKDGDFTYRFDTIRRKTRKTSQWGRDLLGFGLARRLSSIRDSRGQAETFTHPLRSCNQRRRLVRHPP